MLSIILCGHGGFASGLEKAMIQILGEQQQFIAIDFPESSTTELLTSQLEQAVHGLGGSESIIFLTDLLGGTPFRVACTMAACKLINQAGESAMPALQRLGTEFLTT